MRRSDRSIRLGIDLGGTKIEILALDPQGAERFRQRVPTPQGDYAAILRTISTLVDAAEQTLRVVGSVGIGTPGSISRATGLLRGSNSVCMNGKPIKRDLEQLLGREVRITNDANCFALSEASDGAGCGFGVVFGVILGTGVGGGIVVGGRVLDGPNAIAGEWGHNPLPWPRDDERPGDTCFCGHFGCIETFLAGPALERDHARATGEVLTTHAIVERVRSGDAASTAILGRYEERLARALAHVMNILDPDAIVLGGGLSNIESLYVNVPKKWDPWVFSDRIDTRLLKHVHGDASGVRGAAWLWPVSAQAG
ncbi:MAG TPA: ROK family protein [Casimicrobiaceae bacterium]|nr:ROK family protein [Casimicrobiaceae bacterium]